MKVYTFVKGGREWFVDLPEYLEAGGNKADLQMVEGADTMLDSISDGANEISLYLEKEEFPGSDVLILVERCDSSIGGGYYLLATFETVNFNRTMWLCAVTEYVFGELPEKIFIRRAPVRR